MDDSMLFAALLGHCSAADIWNGDDNECRSGMDLSIGCVVKLDFAAGWL